MHSEVETIDPLTAEIPVSSGVPIGVRIALFGGIFIVLLIMSLTAGSSWIGHFWPWSTAMHAKL